jgi:uncharacterized protein YkwD
VLYAQNQSIRPGDALDGSLAALRSMAICGFVVCKSRLGAARKGAFFKEENTLSKGYYLLAAVVVCAGVARAEAETTPFNNQATSINGVFVFPAVGSNAGLRLKRAGSEDTYILELQPEHVQWVNQYANEQVKIQGVYRDGGIITPTSIAPANQASVTAGYQSGASSSITDQTTQQMVDECNRYRQQHGLSPLTPCPNLMQSANTHSYNMRHSYGFRHGGTSGWMAENIASGQPSPQAVTSTWYNSSGHRANMLSPNYRYIGVGHYNGMWTQQFR